MSKGTRRRGNLPPRVRELLRRSGVADGGDQLIEGDALLGPGELREVLAVGLPIARLAAARHPAADASLIDEMLRAPETLNDWDPSIEEVERAVIDKPSEETVLEIAVWVLACRLSEAEVGRARVETEWIDVETLRQRGAVVVRWLCRPRSDRKRELAERARARKTVAAAAGAAESTRKAAARATRWPDGKPLRKWHYESEWEDGNACDTAIDDAAACSGKAIVVVLDGRTAESFKGVFWFRSATRLAETLCFCVTNSFEDWEEPGRIRPNDARLAAYDELVRVLTRLRPEAWSRSAAVGSAVTKVNKLLRKFAETKVVFLGSQSALESSRQPAADKLRRDFRHDRESAQRGPITPRERRGFREWLEAGSGPYSSA